MCSDVVTKVALSRTMIDRLSALRHLSLGISLDSVDPETGDALLRRPGQTKRLMRSVAQLASAGLAITIEATVTRTTFAGLDALERFCAGHNVRALHLRAAAPHKVRPVRDLVPDADMTDRIAARAGKRAGLEIVATPAFTARPSCGEGLDAVTFLPDGTVTKCTASLSRHPKMQYGNLSESSLEDVLLSRARGALLQRVAASARDLDEDQHPAAGRLPCSQLVHLRTGDPLGRRGQP